MSAIDNGRPDSQSYQRVGRQRGQILGQINQNTTQRQQLEVAYQQTAGAIAGLYEFAPDVEGEDSGEIEAPAENGQPDLELAES